MKKMFVPFSLFLTLATGLSFTACKGKAKETTTTNTTTVDTPVTYTPPPVEVSGDETLRTGVMNATKDFPGVNAAVNNGEITVTGDIKRDDWMRLKPMLDALNPKKVNNQLTIK